MRASLALALAVTLIPVLSWAQANQTEPGRYGARTPAPAPTPWAGAAAPTNYLTWAGKSEAGARGSGGGSGAMARPEPLSDWARTRGGQVTAAPGQLRAAPPQIQPAPSPSQVTPAPSSIYEPAPPRQPSSPSQPAPANASGARLYSLHRDFGLQPDPAPAAGVRGFEGPGMTLSDLPDERRPVEERRITDANGKTRIVERPIDGPPPSGLGGF